MGNCDGVEERKEKKKNEEKMGEGFFPCRKLSTKTIRR